MKDNKLVTRQIIVCSICNRVIAQCKWIDHETKITYKVCGECRQKLVDSNSHKHERILCPQCGNIIAQCRCMYDPHDANAVIDSVSDVLCDKCQDKSTQPTILEIKQKMMKITPLEVKIEDQPILMAALGLKPSALVVKGKAAKLTPAFEGILLEVRDKETGKLVTLFVSQELADTLEGQELEVTIKRVDHNKQCGCFQDDVCSWCASQYY